MSTPLNIAKFRKPIYNTRMAKIEAKLQSIIPEHFIRPKPAIAVFVVDLMSHVGKNELIAKLGEENAVHFNIRPANTNPPFFHSFYYEHPLPQADGTFLLGGLDQSMGNTTINSQSHELFRTYELFYDPLDGFRVMALQSAIPTLFIGKDAAILWQSKMSNKGIQRLSKKIRANV